jgi:hypothetical protein
VFWLGVKQDLVKASELYKSGIASGIEYDEKTENIKEATARLKAIKTKIKSNASQLPVKI